MKKNIKKNKNKVGFTIIEVIVSLAIFFFIVGSAVTIFISIIKSQKNVLAEQQLVSQISYLEEYMAKALRMADVQKNGNCVPAGFIYHISHCPGRNLNCPQKSSGGAYEYIRFFNQSCGSIGCCQEFYFEDGLIKESKMINGVWISPAALTSQNVRINKVRFGINGGDGTVYGQNDQGCSDNIDACGAKNTERVQPKVTIVLDVKIPIQDEPNRIIQTTVSQRNLNIAD